MQEKIKRERGEEKAMAIEIDGSMGEGGGQVVRTSLSLSCALGMPIRIKNIRAGRKNAGLGRQHLAVVNALARICDAKVLGNALGSKGLSFEPQEARAGEYGFDIGSAGSVTLLAQAILPVLCIAGEESRVLLKGGTHVKAAPTWEYFENVFLKCVEKFGVRAAGKLASAGFYPKGGGEVEIGVEKCKLNAIDFLERAWEGTKCSIISSRLPAHVAQREKGEMEKILRSARRAEDIAMGGNGMVAGTADAQKQGEVAAGGGGNVNFEIHNCNAACAGNAITVWNGGIGACAIGEAGKKAEEVAQEAARYFANEAGSGAAVDSHCADQLLLYMALANGKCCIRTSQISLHAKTNMEVIEKFGRAKFEVEEEKGSCVIRSEVV